MAAALVGSAGVVSQGGSGASVTPAWDAGATRTAGNLLVCSVSVNGSATVASTPSGWSVGVAGLGGTSCSAIVFTKASVGSDAAPTIAAITSAVISAQLMEFSGVSLATVGDKDGSGAATTSPLTATTSGTDVQAGELVLYASSQFYTQAGTKTNTVALNNGATAQDTNNAATSTANHYNLGYGVTTGNSLSDTATLTYTTTKITGAVVVTGSFALLPSITPTAAVASSATTTLSAFTKLTPLAVNTAAAIAIASVPIQLAVSPTNLAKNPNFEHDTPGGTAGSWITNISADNLNPNAVGVVQASGAHSGSQCLKVTTDTGFSAEGATTSVVPAASLAAGNKYTGTIWLKGDVGSELVQVAFGNTAVYAGTTFTGNLTLTTSWQQFTLSFTVPSGVSFTQDVFFTARTVHADAVSFYIDDVTVIAGASASNIDFSGDSPGAFWTGTPGASTSTHYSAQSAGSAAVTLFAPTPIPLGFGITNEILNGGFEHDTLTAAPAGWLNQTPSTIATFAVQNGWSGSGSQSLRVTTNSMASGTQAAYRNVTGLTVGTAVDVTAIKPYESLLVHAQINILSISAPALIGVNCQVGWFDSAGNNLSYIDGWFLQALGVSTVTGTFTPPSNVAYFTIQIVDNATANAQRIDYYIDSIYVTKTTALTTYVDGDTPGYSWAGTVGNSVSSSVSSAQLVTSAVAQIGIQQLLTVSSLTQTTAGALISAPTLLVPSSMGSYSATELVSATTFFVPLASGISQATELITAITSFTATAQANSSAIELVTAASNLSVSAAQVSAVSNTLTVGAQLDPNALTSTLAINSTTASELLIPSALTASSASEIIITEAQLTPTAISVLSALATLSAITDIFPIAQTSTEASAIVTDIVFLIVAAALATSATGEVGSPILLSLVAQALTQSTCSMLAGEAGSVIMMI